MTMAMAYGEYTAKELNRLGNERSYGKQPSFAETLKILKRQQGVKLDEDPLERPWDSPEPAEKNPVTESEAPASMPELEDLPPKEEAEAMGLFKTKGRTVEFEPVKKLKERIKGLLESDNKSKDVPSEELVLPGEEPKKEKEAEKSWEEIKAEKGRAAKARMEKEATARARAEEEREARKKAQVEAKKKAEENKISKAEPKEKPSESEVKDPEPVVSKDRKAAEAAKRKEAAKRGAEAIRKKRAEEAADLKKVEQENARAAKIAEIRKRVEAERAARKKLEKEQAKAAKAKKPKVKEGMQPANPEKVRRYGAKGESEPLLKRILSLGKKDEKTPVKTEEKKPEVKKAEPKKTEPKAKEDDGHILDRLLDRFKKEKKPSNSAGSEEKKVGGSRRDEDKTESTSPIRRLVF